MDELRMVLDDEAVQIADSTYVRPEEIFFHAIEDPADDDVRTVERALLFALRDGLVRHLAGQLLAAPVCAA